LVYVTLQDSGGTIPAKFVPITNAIGRDESDALIFAIEVKPKNDAPYFQMLEHIEVAAGTGFTRIEHFAHNISAGPANEFAQTLTFVLTSVVDAGTLFAPEMFFAELPSMDVFGTLIFTPASRVSGTVQFTFTLFDNGGVGVGHYNSFSRSAKISVESVNYAPSFAVPERVLQLASKASPVTFRQQVLANISKGAIDEDFLQTLTFTIHNISNEHIFSQVPTFEADGFLLFVVAPGAQGSSTIRFSVKDDGGVERGGKDTSDLDELTIVIVKTNVAPSFDLVADSVVFVEDAGLYKQVDFAYNISRGAPDETDQTLYFNVTLMSVSPNLFEIEPFVDDNGTLTFRTANGAFGSASVSIKLTDSGGTDYDGMDETAS
jgi:hypothetical protein